MRKIIVSNLITVDNFYAGPKGEIDWFITNDEFFAFSNQQLTEVDTLLFGRVTYEGMRDFWTSDQAQADDPYTADKMNTLPKLVFSRTLDTADWGQWDNATILKGDMAEEITRLKQQPGKDIVIFGSGSIVSALTKLRLIDEYRLLIIPTILGKGKPEFVGITQPLKLKLLKSQTYKTGVVILFYEPA